MGVATKYILHLSANKGLQASTVEAHLAGLATILKFLGGSFPSRDKGIVQMLKGISRS